MKKRKKALMSKKDLTAKLYELRGEYDIAAEDLKDADLDVCKRLAELRIWLIEGEILRCLKDAIKLLNFYEFMAHDKDRIIKVLEAKSKPHRRIKP